MQTFHRYRRFVTVVLLSLGLALAASTRPGPAISSTTGRRLCPPCLVRAAAARAIAPRAAPTTTAAAPRRPVATSSLAPVRYFNGEIRMTADDLGGGAALGPHPFLQQPLPQRQQLRQRQPLVRPAVAAVGPRGLGDHGPVRAVEGLLVRPGPGRLRGPLRRQADPGPRHDQPRLPHDRSRRHGVGILRVRPGQQHAHHAARRALQAAHHPRRPDGHSDPMHRDPDPPGPTHQPGPKHPFEQYDYSYYRGGVNNGQLPSVTLSRCQRHVAGCPSARSATPTMARTTPAACRATSKRPSARPGDGSQWTAATPITIATTSRRGRHSASPTA